MVDTRARDPPVKMRNPKQNARLQQARGQLFICSMFGTCASSVLSPRTPPSGDKRDFPDYSQQQQQHPGIDITPSELLLRHSQTILHCDDFDNRAPMTSYPSSTSATSSATSSSSVFPDLEDLLTEINAGNITKTTIGALTSKLGNTQNSRELIIASKVSSSLMTLLLSSELAAAVVVKDDDERHVLEESLSCLAAMAEFDEAAVQAMATAEFLVVVMWFVREGRQDVREKGGMLLEKLSLVEGFKGTMGEGERGVMQALNEMLRDEKHLKLVKLATRTLLALCLHQENRRRAVDVGVASSLIEMLPRARSASAEKALATLELLCTTEEGKAALIDHALAVPVLVELILKISDRGTEYATGTLSSMCSDSVAMREAAVAHCAPKKLLLLIQSDCTARAKRKASQLLKALHKIWAQENCNPDNSGIHAIRY